MEDGESSEGGTDEDDGTGTLDSGEKDGGEDRASFA